MAIHFFLDWCPMGTAGADLGNDLAIQRRNSTLRNKLTDICTDRTDTTPAVVEFAAREDGLFLFALDLPDTTGRGQIFQTASEVASVIKEDALDHKHHHHLDAKDTAGKANPRASHDPVRIDMPSRIVANLSELKARELRFIAATRAERIDALTEILKSNADVSILTAQHAGCVWNAMQLLDTFIARRHDQALKMHRTLTRSYEWRRKRNFVRSCTIAVLSFAALFGGAWWMNLPGLPAACVATLLLGLLIGVSCYGWIDENANGRLLSAVRSHQGYLQRANDFAIVLANVMAARPAGAPALHTSTRGYDSLIGSLEVLIANVVSTVERSRSRNSQIVVGLGVAAAVIAIFGLEFGANLAAAAGDGSTVSGAAQVKP